MKIKHRFKPAVRKKNLLLTAALLWSGVGVMLLIRGVRLLGHPAAMLYLLLAAIAVGTMKALLVLDKTARRNIHRIAQMNDGTCIGAVYSWKMWLMVLGMIFLGRALRLSGIVPVMYVGLLYVAIGWALFLASRLLWKQLFQPS